MVRRQWITGPVTLAVGLLLAVFFVFRTLFTDGPGDAWHPEYLFAHALSLLVYAGAAFAAARWGHLGWLSLAWLLPPAVLVLVLYREPTADLLAMQGAAVAIGAVAGAAWGVRSGQEARAARP